MSGKEGGARPTPWVCLRCGHRYEEPFDPKAPLIERQCPRCRSNSVRRPRAGREAPPEETA